MNDLEYIAEWLARLEREHKDHVALTRNMFKRGPVAERDKDKGVRLQTDEGNGEDGKPHLEPWCQPAERSGFERYVPRKGQQALLFAPYGNPEEGIIVGYGHNDANRNPASDVDEVVIANHGKIKLSIDKAGTSLIFVNDKVKTVWEGAKITHTVDGNTTVFEKDAVTFPDGSKVRHGDRNIGKDHVHGGVKSGGDKSSNPEA